MTGPITLDARLYASLATPTTSLATFTGRLRKRLKTGEVRPFDGIDLSRTLEMVMKVAKHELETVPTRLRAAEVDDPKAAIDPARALAKDTLELAIWLCTQSAPRWLLGHLRAAEVYSALAARAEAAGELRQSLHATVARMLLPATALRTDDTLSVDDVRRASRLETAIGPGSIREEIEAWHDVFTSYGMMRT